MDKGANVDGYVTPFDAYKMSLKRAGHYSHLNVSGFWMGSGNGIGNVALVIHGTDRWQNLTLTLQEH